MYIFVYPSYIILSEHEMKVTYPFRRKKRILYSEIKSYNIDGFLQIINLKFKNSKKQIEFHYFPSELHNIRRVFDQNRIMVEAEL